MRATASRGRSVTAIVCTLLASAACGGAGRAQIAVAALDGKQAEAGYPAGSRSDAVAVIDLNAYPPRIVGSVAAPASMIGPPSSVAVAPDESFAIVTAAQRVDPGDPPRLVPADTVSVIDLADPHRPVVVQTIAAGAGASGVSINRAGTLALVANAVDGSISIFSIAGKRLTRRRTVQLDARLAPVDVALSPDGRTALATQRQGKAVWRLAIDGDSATVATAIPVGLGSFGAVFGRDGRYAYNSNQQGGLPLKPVPAPNPALPAPGTVSVVELATSRVVSVVAVGPSPEHVSLSPDGRYLGVTVVNGSSSSPDAADYRPYGVLQIYQVAGATLKPIAETRTGRLPQGMTWRRDGRVILVESAIEQRIEVYRFDGRRLARDDAATLSFAARPGAIATSLDR